MAEPALILASTSTYRRELLQRLQLDFRCVAPEVDESRRAEAAAARALRLAQAKALAVSRAEPAALVIGSDQVCSCEGEVLRKPGTPERQREQLAQLSGQSVQFDTAVCLAADGRALGSLLVPTQVQFRALTTLEISSYVQREPAADCAGGFKVEGLGITLFEWIRSDDPTALVGLPLMATATLLRAQGLLTQAS